MRSALIMSVALGLASTLARPHALACSCIPARLSRTTLPVDGSVDFPTDGALRVFLRSFPRSLRSALAAEYRLTDSQGAEVALDASVTATRLDLRPHTALRAHTRYTLSRLYTYDQTGTLLSDDEHIQQCYDTYRRPGASAPSLRRVWFPEVRFETGDGPGAPHAAVPSHLVATTMLRFGGGDCGPGIGLDAAFHVPSSTLATDVATLEIRAPGVAPTLVATQPARGIDSLMASDLLCNPDPVHVPSHLQLEARVIVQDAAGTTVGESPWVAAVSPDRGSLSANAESNRRGLSPASDALVQRWQSPPIVQATAMGAQGPTSCAYGFEVTSTREVSHEGAPFSYEDISTLTVDGDRAWVTVRANRADTLTRVLAIPSQGAATVLRPALAGTVTAAVASPAGPFVVARTYAPSDGFSLLSLDRNGRTLWQRSLNAHRDGHRVAVGANRVLVLDRKTESFQARPFGWALFDARTGAPIGRARDSDEPVNGDGSVAAAWVRDRFVIAWTARIDDRNTRVRVATVRPDGAMSAPVTLAIPVDGPIDLASSGDRVALVSESGGAVSWTLLDAAGAVQRGPIVVSGGVGGRDNRKPRVSVREGLFAVSWETHPTGAVYAVAVDVTGAFSPALTIAERDAATVFVAAREGGEYLASYSAEIDEGALQVATLRCRASAPAGAPQRIAPVR